MILKGNRIVLRPIELEDIEFMRDLINDPETESTIVGWALPISKSDQEKWFSNFKNNNDTIRYVIDSKEEGIIGFTGITDIDWKNGTARDTGIRIKKDFRGKGYATETYTVILNYVFNELRLNRFSSSALEMNKQSLRFLEKSGFIKEGVLRKAIYKNGQYHNIILLGILKEEFMTNRK